jgi:hypothetical protein
VRWLYSAVAPRNDYVKVTLQVYNNCLLRTQGSGEVAKSSLLSHSQTTLVRPRIFDSETHGKATVKSRKMRRVAQAQASRERRSGGSSREPTRKLQDRGTSLLMLPA